MHAREVGVQSDDVEAYLWLALAATARESEVAKCAAEARRQVWQRMSPSEVVEAERRGAVFVPRRSAPRTGEPAPH